MVEADLVEFVLHARRRGGRSAHGRRVTKGRGTATRRARPRPGPRVPVRPRPPGRTKSTPRATQRLGVKAWEAGFGEAAGRDGGEGARVGGKGARLHLAARQALVEHDHLQASRPHSPIPRPHSPIPRPHPQAIPVGHPNPRGHRDAHSPARARARTQTSAPSHARTQATRFARAHPCTLAARKHAPAPRVLARATGTRQRPGAPRRTQSRAHARTHHVACARPRLQAVFRSVDRIRRPTAGSRPPAAGSELRQ